MYKKILLWLKWRLAGDELRELTYLKHRVKTLGDACSKEMPVVQDVSVHMLTGGDAAAFKKRLRSQYPWLPEPTSSSAKSYQTGSLRRARTIGESCNVTDRE